MFDSKSELKQLLHTKQKYRALGSIFILKVQNCSCPMLNTNTTIFWMNRVCCCCFFLLCAVLCSFPRVNSNWNSNLPISCHLGVYKLSLSKTRVRQRLGDSPGSLFPARCSSLAERSLVSISQYLSVLFPVLTH